MKTAWIALFTLLLSAESAIARETAATDPAEAYARAVSSYVSAAGQQLTSIRAQVEAEVKPGAADVRQRYATVLTELDRCDRLLVELKDAPPASFDAIKADFERVRGEMVKALETARRGQPPPAP